MGDKRKVNWFESGRMARALAGVDGRPTTVEAARLPFLDDMPSADDAFAFERGWNFASVRMVFEDLKDLMSGMDDGALARLAREMGRIVSDFAPPAAASSTGDRPTLSEQSA